MSAASSAHPGPGHPYLAAVVPLDQAARPRRHPRSERTSVPSQPIGDLTPRQQLAATLEAVFARQHRSLTDKGTAGDFRITLGEVRKLLRGALERHLLNEDQFRTLDGMVEGMEAAPGLLTGAD